MIKSMTGFGSREKDIAPFGRISVELRSTNHKFQEALIHMPEGFLPLEDRLKKEIEAKIKRGRVTCAINIIGRKTTSVFMNRPLIKNYLSSLKKIKKEFHLKDEVSLSGLINLPGVISLETNRVSDSAVWPHLKVLLKGALEELLKSRQKEGKATYYFLKNRADGLNLNLGLIKSHFKKALKNKIKGIATNEERASFLKDSDISEEIERLSFHIRNFRHKIAKSGPK